MLDKEKIISSQLLEQYALGTLSAELITPVEEALAEYEELRTLLRDIEVALENIALENATTPPASVKSSILNSIADKSLKTSTTTASTATNYRWLVAASIILLLGIGFVWQYTSNRSLNEEIKMVEREKEVLLQDLNQLTNSFDEIEALTAFLNDPKTARVVLNGNEKSPNSSVVSYFNTDEERVIITTDQLQPLTPDQDYQMWADVEGEMIDMGVIDTEQQLLSMNFIPEAESFNITIEPQGGSDHPTVANLIANTYLD